MTSRPHIWETIHAAGLWREHEPIPAFEQILGRFLESAPAPRLLDLGCGNGRHTQPLAARGCVVVGADIAPSALRQTRTRLDAAGLGGTLLQVDFRQPLPFRAGCFDGVLSTQVIHHARLAQVRLAMREIFRVLRPGGLGYLTVGGLKEEDVSYTEIEPGTFLPLDGVEAGLPHHLFNGPEAQRELEAAGFKVLELRVHLEGKVNAAWVRKV